MSEQEPNKHTTVDWLVEKLAAAMDAVGLNGRRVLWRWNQKRRSLAEAGVRGEQMVKSAKAQHKMCPACRTLVGRSESTCPDCGASLDEVASPGVGRVLTNILPGVTAATSLLMLVNGFWFVMMLMAQIKAGGAPGLFSGFDGELVVRFGSGLNDPRMLSDGTVTGGEWWRIITPIFLHGSLLHFFFNSYLLLNLGPIVEDMWGTERFWVIYLACGIVGSATTQLLHSYINTVGASGAIMGLIGLLLVYGFRHHGALGESMKQLLIRLLIYTLVLSFLMGFNIDHLNHLGGFVCGAVLALVVPTRPMSTRGERLFWQAASIGGVLLVLLAFYNVAEFATS